MVLMGIVALGLAALGQGKAGEVWTVRVEEPTGLYARAEEVVAVPLARLGERRSGFRVLDPAGKEVAWQVAGEELLFPAEAVPGQPAAYRVWCCREEAGEGFENGIVLRRVGMRRVELGNSRFRMVIDLGVPAIVEAYTLTAGRERMLNLVETSPEDARTLRNDIHPGAMPQPVAGVEGENVGWAGAARKGAPAEAEFVETGPVRGRLRLKGEGVEWEMVWTAASGWVRWRGPREFRLLAISASPYLPFDRCWDGSEYDWPTGPGEDDPGGHEIGSRAFSKLPGGHVVYYRHEEDYGALGVVALDAELDWRGACTRRVIGAKAAGVGEIALTFPRWRRHETVLEARREYRILKEALLTRVSGPEAGEVKVERAAARVARVEIRRGAPAGAFRAEEMSLDGEWEAAWAEKGQGPPKEGWRRVRVPGTAHIQWLGEEKAMTREAEWVSRKEWWYRKRFRLPEWEAERVLRLEFEATDYYAEAWLNGEYLGGHEGYIDPYDYDISRVARRKEENELLVRVWTPVSYYWKHRPYTVKGAYGAVDQKPDDITATGITRSVRVRARRGARITDIAVASRLAGAGAEVEVELEAELSGEGYQWEATLEPRNFEGGAAVQAVAAAGAGRRRVTIPVSEPRLWWTWDHGRPNLYTLRVRLVEAGGRAVDGRELAVGIREIEKIGWDFYLNRKRMFIRGTNYYFHLFLSEMNRASYERDLDLMLKMNVNMIRLHCHFTNREFYELADERGVLIWQDYLEAWYPHDRRFSLHAAALYDNHLRYVRNHASVALWATSDEEDMENYRDLTKHLEPRPYLLDPQRRAVVRSTGRFGDAHVYHGWYGGSIWEYARLEAPFVSELGATALPNYETLEKYMPGLWPIAAHEAEWKWRRLQIKEAMAAWGEPGGLALKEYIPRTQAYVARLFQLALERARRQKNKGTGGILHFHAIDIWPSVTMAAIDYDRQPTKAFDTVRRSFAPVAAVFEYYRDRWRVGEEFRCGVWGVNDRWEAVEGARIAWRIEDAGGRVLARGAWKADLGADSAVAIGEVRWRAAAAGEHRLVASVENGAGRVVSENVFEFGVIVGEQR